MLQIPQHLYYDKTSTVIGDDDCYAIKNLQPHARYTFWHLTGYNIHHDALITDASKISYTAYTTPVYKPTI